MRATAMARVARLSAPAFRLAGVRPDALPLSMLWVPRGARLVRRRVKEHPPDVVLATGPPMAGPLAARLGVPRGTPLIVELRDLWAASPAFDAGGRLLGAVESWLLGRAQRVVACTPEAAADLRLRHSELAERVVEVSNGFDPEILSLVATGAGASAADPRRALTLLHSGTLTPARPLSPVLRALVDPRVAGSFRLVLHGYLSPVNRAEVERAQQDDAAPVEVLPPSPWREAVARMERADACLITQAREAGDATAIASKVFEYLALGKPVVCVTDGGATEALLCRLGDGELCARLDRPESVVQALLRLREGAIPPLSPKRLERYSRRELAGDMAEVLSEASAGG
jgi:glycosyltransferase involved in cell wall biosynthesis